MKNWQIEFFLASALHTPEQQYRIEELSLDLVDAGAEGTTYSYFHSITAYFLSSSKDTAINFASSIKNEIISHFNITQLEDKNWTQSNSDLLKPLTIGMLTVQPVLSANEMHVPRANHTLYIIPGMGFGTGHHPTTSSIILLLQHRDTISRLKDRPALIFDFGTGSGLLSIAAEHLFPKAVVRAVDNDNAAIANAVENASLNACNNISFQIADIIEGGPHELIMANIYAEILVQYENSMYHELCASGLLILSGIMKEKTRLIDLQFSSPRWNLLHDISDSSGWVTRAYRRNE